MGEILTVKEVAQLLKISTRHVYELAKKEENPLPMVRFGTSVRFRKSAVDAWVLSLEAKAA